MYETSCVSLEYKHITHITNNINKTIKTNHCSLAVVPKVVCRANLEGIYLCNSRKTNFAFTKYFIRHKQYIYKHCRSTSYRKQKTQGKFIGILLEIMANSQ